MRVRLKGLHSSSKRLASGEMRKLWYAWRGGPPLPGEPGSPEFIAAYNAAIAGRQRHMERRTLAGLVNAFQDSRDFPTNAKTAKQYRGYLGSIRAMFGPMTYEQIEARGSRHLFVEWRDELAGTRGARTADLILAVFARCLSWAANREMIGRNPLEKIGRIHKANRADCIWTPGEESALHASASASISLACHIAAWTGQRQGDILRLTWGAYDGRSLLVRQSKTGAAVRVPVAAPLKVLLDATKRRSTHIVTTERAAKGSAGEVHKPYSEDGFRASFAAAREAAGIGNLTFHDFRGTFVTRAKEAGATDAEVSAVTGHGQGGNVLSVSYTSYTYDMALACIGKLEKWHEARTNLHAGLHAG